MRREEIPVCGLKAVRALFTQHPQSIERLYFDHETSKRVGVITQTLAKSRKVYRVVEPSELEKISGTVHHGGIVAVIVQAAFRSPLPADVVNWARRREPLLLLDRIGNSHNLGAIVRSAAWFGVPYVILPKHSQAALPGEATWRIAEGGMEYVDFFQVQNLAEFCRSIAIHYEVVGTSLRGKDLEYHGRPSEKPVALVLGNEEAGMSDEVAAACTRLVKIPGSSTVESLNVSVAAAILIWEFYGRKPRRP
ncbi:MAG TPA: RNA methyltransferase [Opitutaceae bacterium]|nr:RNA methyltransferase [Opitutaceae bacterium]